MNAHTFDHDAVICPLCHRDGRIGPHRLLNGLLTCSHCRERFVVSRSGHFVRDPFTLKQLADSRTLRRQSHPFARILRDFGFSKYPSLFAIASSVVLLGLTLTAVGDWAVPQASVPGVVNHITETLGIDETDP
ncbi:MULTISPECIES: hypothetical protein [Trichocoleus]|uniref:Uncharacterized protein n=1 Tax=Trichocoleus desertorum GB2-A4 TaxID=2933944 RepID=A0ABV0JBI3_9CYAN|nr:MULTISPECIES: hypothetical protein [unclassified Trichocoleus]MBD1860926.1 hypothetical protein [Trichocoleus sp. FACHB-46]MBD2122738.1 hypothetical protein [Trichocoleus sp. FACHB-262]